MMWDVGADHSDVPVLVWALVHTVLPLFFSILCFRQPQEVNHRFPISHHVLLVNGGSSDDDDFDDVSFRSWEMNFPTMKMI